MSFKEFFKQPITEEFDQTQFVELAKKWLLTKFPKEEYGYEFEHNPRLEVPDMKQYNAYIDGKAFLIIGKAFDTNSNGEKDTVIFKIQPIETEEEEQEDAF